MKLWQKVFLCTFILFEFVFLSASLYLIEHNFNRNLQKEIERGLSEQHIIYSGIQTNWTYIDNLNQKLGLTRESIRQFLQTASQEYTGYFDKKLVSIEILDENNEAVYNNFNEKFDGVREELNVPLSNSRKYIIRDIGPKSYLFVTNELKLKDNSFKLSYIRDISDIYAEKSAQYGLFLKMNIVITCILAIGLYLIIWYLTRSIRKLTGTAQTIAAGDYSQRVQVLSEDEVGILAANFNQMAEAVEDKVEELGKIAHSKQDFIEYLTHELKTPLTSIIGYADLLRTSRYDEEIFFSSLNYIYSEGKRLESLSFRLMDLIFIENGEPALRGENIQQLCSEIEEVLKPRLLSLNIGLVMEVEACVVLLEKELFRMLCTNLLDNAMKASPEDARIFLRGYRTGENFFVLEVEDSGIGIPEQDIQKVFEPFFMVNKVTSRAQHGAGLGLAICAEIVKLHNGKIEIESRLNMGTKVRITFPGVCN